MFHESFLGELSKVMVKDIDPSLYPYKSSQGCQQKCEKPQVGSLF